jgi:hypothetical protein
MRKYLVVVLLFFAGIAFKAQAQNVYAALHGTVTDSTGSVIPNATVTVQNTSTGITTVRRADSNGYYIFTQLQVGGPYTVTVSSPGFESFVANGLTLNVNDNREVDGKLQVGAASQTVEVSASALQVETSNTQLQQVATEDQLEEIPLEGRDPAGLQKLEPGVVESSDRFGSYSSNGNQTTQNAYMLNGADINDGPLQDEGIQINPDALHEENIITSTMNPEFSRNSGAVVNQIIKSGSNSFHGSGFEFYRDTFLNNGNYFSQIRPVFHQNLYGGTLGGPIFKNKFFFFVAYQGLRNRTGETENPTTLDSEQFAGNFSGDANYFTGGTNSTGLTTNPIPYSFGSCTGRRDVGGLLCGWVGRDSEYRMEFSRFGVGDQVHSGSEHCGGHLFIQCTEYAGAGPGNHSRGLHAQRAGHDLGIERGAVESEHEWAVVRGRQLSGIRTACVGTLQDLQRVVHAYVRLEHAERTARWLLPVELPFGDSDAGAIAELTGFLDQSAIGAVRHSVYEHRLVLQPGQQLRGAAATHGYKPDLCGQLHMGKGKSLAEVWRIV